MPWNIPTEITLHLGNEGYDFFEKDKDNILVDIILGILLEDIFREPILQRIRIKVIQRKFKDKNKENNYFKLWEFTWGLTIHQYLILLRPIVFCLHLLCLCLNRRLGLIFDMRSIMENRTLTYDLNVDEAFEIFDRAHVS